MSDYKPQVGDRVRVVLEGEVSWTNGSSSDIRTEAGGAFAAEVTHDLAVSIEKIEPPVEVFGPGDVLRSLQDGVSVYVIGRDGYFSFQGNDFREHDESFLQETFTSEDYERVELG